MSISNRRVKNYEKLDSPNQIKKEIKLSSETEKYVDESIKSIENIIDRKSNRKIIIVGPCSIHEKDSALDYAKKLKELQPKVEDKFLLVMRTYFEKPRTCLGWKGLISDPKLDESNDLNYGRKLSRDIANQIVSMGVPIATEFVNEITPQYLDDLVSWAAIGARSTEAPRYKELVSGLSMSVGVKNTTNGKIDAAINLMLAAKKSHSFPGIDYDNKQCQVNTNGNPYTHIVLRGGENLTNYDAETISEISKQIEGKNLKPNIMVDCSHANSFKNHTKQGFVFEKVIDQIYNGNENIIGILLESYINAGNQSFPKSKEEIMNLNYGQSITDECIGWNKTEELILGAYEKLKNNS
jgi:3-deoxy-7-phosphoheptulonate synthase